MKNSDGEKKMTTDSELVKAWKEFKEFNAKRLEGLRAQPKAPPAVDELRAAFEMLVDDAGSYDFTLDDDGDYVKPDTWEAYQGWKAALTYLSNPTLHTVAAKAPPAVDELQTVAVQMREALREALLQFDGLPRQKMNEYGGMSYVSELDYCYGAALNQIKAAIEDYDKLMEVPASHPQGKRNGLSASAKESTMEGK